MPIVLIAPERTLAHLSPDARREAVRLLDVRERVTLVWKTSTGTVLQIPLGTSRGDHRMPALSLRFAQLPIAA
jgi:hypothetical protein